MMRSESHSPTPLVCDPKLVGYARVSTADQKLDMQLDALNAVPCDLVFSDHGISGAKPTRPGLDQALKALESGDTLIVFKLDRLARSVLQLADLLTRFHNQGISFRSISEGINTSTPGGKMVYHVFSAVAEFERDIIRERTILGLAAARSRGAKLGRPYALDEYEILEAHRQVKQLGEPVNVIAKRCGVSRSTLVRAFERLNLPNI